MNIIILCDQIDCLFNKTTELPTGTEWRMKGDSICTNKHPVFSVVMHKRHCNSKLVHQNKITTKDLKDIDEANDERK